MIVAGQADGFLGFTEFFAQARDGLIHLEQHGAACIVTHHALGPEEGADPLAACHWLDPVQAGGGVEDEIARRQLDLVRAVGVNHDQLAALVVLGLAEKQRAGHIGAQPLLGARDAACRTVHMQAVGFAVAVAVEQRRHGARGQGGAEEQRAGGQRLQDDAALLLGYGRVLGQLPVALDLGALAAHGGAAVDPVGGSYGGTHAGDLLAAQDIEDVQHHGENLLKWRSPAWARLLVGKWIAVAEDGATQVRDSEQAPPRSKGCPSEAVVPLRRSAPERGKARQRLRGRTSNQNLKFAVRRAERAMPGK